MPLELRLCTAGARCFDADVHIPGWYTAIGGWYYKCRSPTHLQLKTYLFRDCSGESTTNVVMEVGKCVKLYASNEMYNGVRLELYVKLSKLEGCTGTYDDDDGDADCFGREHAAACRLLDGSASAAAAHAACWGAASPNARHAAVAALVPMSDLVAGDLILTEKGGLVNVDRVIVNQHRAESPTARSAALLTLSYTTGSLTATPNHMVWLDGGFAPARTAAVGSVLSNGLAVTAITAHVGGIVNPIVAGGTILASDKAGGPVLAATADEWTADVLLSAYPKCSPSCALAAAFPAAAQAYWDDALEPLFNAAVPTLRTLKAAAPAPLVGLALVAGDAALAAGLGAYTLGLKGAATLAGAALAAVAMRRAARK